MESIHDQAAQFGIQKPELEHKQHMDGDVTVISLTQQSEQDWANYLRAITMAKLAIRTEL